MAAWREAPYFTEAERAALALSEAATRLADRPDPVPDAVWDEAAKHYDERGLAALVLMIGMTNTVQPAQRHDEARSPAGSPGDPAARLRRRAGTRAMVAGCD